MRQRKSGFFQRFPVLRRPSMGLENVSCEGPHAALVGFDHVVPASIEADGLVVHVQPPVLSIAALVIFDGWASFPWRCSGGSFSRSIPKKGPLRWIAAAGLPFAVGADCRAAQNTKHEPSGTTGTHKGFDIWFKTKVNELVLLDVTGATNAGTCKAKAEQIAQNAAAVMNEAQMQNATVL
eukprot:s9872_g1.t1